MKTLLTVAVMCCAATGFAQERGMGMPPMDKIMERIDANEDGKVSKEEASKMRRGKLAEDFDEADTDNDGFLVLEELKAYFEKQRANR